MKKWKPINYPIADKLLKSSPKEKFPRSLNLKSLNSK